MKLSEVERGTCPMQCPMAGDATDFSTMLQCDTASALCYVRVYQSLADSL